MHQPLPIAAPNGLPYGARGELVGMQKSVPMSPAPGPAAPQPSPAGPVPGSPGIHLMRPTDRPNEPVTAGLPMGAGPGPEVLQNTGAAQGNVAQLLGQLAQQPGATSDVSELAHFAANHA